MQRPIQFLVLHVRPGFLVLEVSGSYQTMARRLEAMKHIQSFSRGQVLLAGLAIALLGAIAVVPWRVVAQEARGSGEAEKAAAANDATAAGQAKPGRLLEQLVVGMWRGGPSGNDVLVIGKDGKYGWLFRTDDQVGGGMLGRGVFPAGQSFRGAPVGYGVMGGAAPMNHPRYSDNSGRWRVEGDTLILSYAPASAVLKGLTASGLSVTTGQMPDQWPADFVGSDTGMKARLKIVRLDDSLLRLLGMVTNDQGDETATTPKFFRRVDEKEAIPKFGADTPKEFERIAELAHLNAAERPSLVKWLIDVNGQRKGANQE